MSQESINVGKYKYRTFLELAQFISKCINAPVEKVKKGKTLKDKKVLLDLTGALKRKVMEQPPRQKKKLRYSDQIVEARKRIVQDLRSQIRRMPAVPKDWEPPKKGVRSPFDSCCLFTCIKFETIIWEG